MADDSLVQFSNNSEISCASGQTLVKKPSGIYQCETNLGEQLKREKEYKHLVNEKERLTLSMHSLRQEGLLLEEDATYIMTTVAARGEAAYNRRLNIGTKEDAMRARIETELDVLHMMLNEYINSEAIQSEQQTLHNVVETKVSPEILQEIEVAEARMQQLFLASVVLSGFAFLV